MRSAITDMRDVVSEHTAHADDLQVRLQTICFSFYGPYKTYAC